MKKVLLLNVLMNICLYAQTFVVEKVNGDVRVLLGMSENWVIVKPGDVLKGNDLISTGEKSLIQLNNNGNGFVLRSNSALSINNIRKITLNELLLALAMEEIRNIPRHKKNDIRRNTAVYGENIQGIHKSESIGRDLGIKKLNGAKQLAYSGYKESAILLAIETYRKYPSTKYNIVDRLFFVDLMIDMGLFNESLEELNDLKVLCTNKEMLNKIEDRI